MRMMSPHFSLVQVLAAGRLVVRQVLTHEVDQLVGADVAGVVQAALVEAAH